MVKFRVRLWAFFYCLFTLFSNVFCFYSFNLVVILTDLTQKPRIFDSCTSTGNHFSEWLLKLKKQKHGLDIHCIQSARIRSFSGPYFPSFGPHTERYEVSLCIQSECGKKRTRKSPNTDTFNVVITLANFIIQLSNICNY